MNINNVASLMIEDVQTVGVTFNPDGNASMVYTYKTMGDYAVGDKALVLAQGNYKVVHVVEVHETPQIEPDSETNYTWLVQKIDTTNYDKLIEAEKQFKSNLLIAQQKSVISNIKENLAAMFGIENTKLLAKSISELNAATNKKQD